MAKAALTDVKGIGAVSVQALRKAGIRDVESLASASIQAIAAVPGLGPPGRQR